LSSLANSSLAKTSFGSSANAFSKCSRALCLLSLAANSCPASSHTCAVLVHLLVLIKHISNQSALPLVVFCPTAATAVRAREPRRDGRTRAKKRRGRRAATDRSHEDPPLCISKPLHQKQNKPQHMLSFSGGVFTWSTAGGPRRVCRVW
jgi:hypothetical protein